MSTCGAHTASTIHIVTLVLRNLLYYGTCDPWCCVITRMRWAGVQYSVICFSPPVQLLQLTGVQITIAGVHRPRNL